MKNSKAQFYDFINKLKLPDDKEELLSIGFLVFENLFGLSRTEIMSDKSIIDHSEKLQAVAARLNDHEPIQYILGEAWFFGRRFKVTPSVLIPRPETEELVQYVIDFYKRRASTHLDVLDIGTGSGCIAISLSLNFPSATIVATDISDEALSVAKQNDGANRSAVKFIQHDIINDALPLKQFDIIVSNPPYISNEEKGSMKSNVLQFEPHLALFVSGSDPLLFYRIIARRAKEALKENGMLCTEINAHFGREVSEIFSEAGFRNISVVRDLQGKERIVSGILNS